MYSIAGYPKLGEIRGGNTVGVGSMENKEANRMIDEPEYDLPIER